MCNTVKDQITNAFYARFALSTIDSIGLQYERRSLKVPWNNPILAKDSTYPIQEEWNISNAM